MLREYRIVEVLGVGGFGITYKVYDTNLDTMMAIKEYMPKQFASRTNNTTVTCISKDKDTFEWGKSRFLEEARILRKFDHPSIVKVLNLFEANNTAYFVMDYYEGETLEKYLKERADKEFSQEEILTIMMPITEGLKEVHSKGYLHRDISPDNIFLRVNKLPVLIDFGASRNALGNKSQNISAIIKHGYSPPEQYTSNTRQDAATDIYALSAVIYQMITGEVPPESPQRQTEILNGNKDPIKNIVEEYKGKYSDSFLKTVQKGLALLQKDRIQTISEFQDGLVGNEIVDNGSNNSNNNRKNSKKIDVDNPKKRYIIGFLALLIVLLAGYGIFKFLDKPKKVLSKQEKLEQSCNAGNGSDCKKLAIMYDKGDGVKKDKKRALEFYQKACDAKDGWSCYTLGYIYQSGNGVAKDKKKALELYKRACDNSEASGCYNLGYIYQYGDGVAKDEEKAVALYKKACDKGNSFGCNSLGYMYDYGVGVAKDKSKAVELYKKACDKGNVIGCYNLAYMYQSGIGVGEDKIKAVELYRKACDKNNASSCYNLGYMYQYGDGIAKDSVKAAALYRKACDNGEPLGCKKLGIMYSKGIGVKKDKSKAIELYKRACDKGNAWSCYSLAYMYQYGDGVFIDKKMAAKLYEKACNKGENPACNNLGYMYQYGDGIPMDKSKAAQFYKKACDNGEASSCYNLGYMYENGDGIAKDENMALELYKKTCKGGYKNACSKINNNLF